MNTNSNTYENNSELEKSVTECFLNTFQRLSEVRKKIWQYLQFLAKNYRRVFPSHASIAKAVGCCRDTVIEALKFFSGLGWLGWVNKCYRSNDYFLTQELIDLDTQNPDTFRRKPTVKPTVSPTENPTLYKTYSCESVVRSTSQTESVQSSNKEKEQVLSKIGEFSKKDLFCLCRFPLQAIRLAYEDWSTRSAKKQIANVAAWITSRCKEHSKLYATY